jgi:hypothetical protein
MPPEVLRTFMGTSIVKSGIKCCRSYAGFLKKGGRNKKIRMRD